MPRTRCSDSCCRRRDVQQRRGMLLDRDGEWTGWDCRQFHQSRSRSAGGVGSVPRSGRGWRKPDNQRVFDRRGRLWAGRRHGWRARILRRLSGAVFRGCRSLAAARWRWRRRRVLELEPASRLDMLRRRRRRRRRRASHCRKRYAHDHGRVRTLQTVEWAEDTSNGNCGAGGAGGAGGAIRLLFANRFVGSGPAELYAQGGLGGYNAQTGGAGRVRLESMDSSSQTTFTANPPAQRIVGPTPLANPLSPTVSIISVGGNTIPCLPAR